MLVFDFLFVVFYRWSRIITRRGNDRRLTSVMLMSILFCVPVVVILKLIVRRISSFDIKKNHIDLFILFVIYVSLFFVYDYGRMRKIAKSKVLCFGKKIWISDLLVLFVVSSVLIAAYLS